MKVAELVQERRRNWQELEQLCMKLEAARRRPIGAADVSRFSSLYRAACADLALADSYQLPPNTIQYLHRLVGRAHNQLYRTNTFEMSRWFHTLLYEVPQRIFRDPCIQVSFFLFWGIFIAAAVLSASPRLWPGFAEAVASEAMLEQLEDSFSQRPSGRDPIINPAMAAFYIHHNTGIGLSCFAGGMLFLPGIVITVYNAAALGACFGYMSRPDIAAGQNFFEFVTAHGPFELTAIVLSAGAGLRLGLGWIRTLGLRRADSLRKAATEAMPIMGAAMILFFMAAMIEAFISPSALPYWFKATIAVLCSGLLMTYFVILGYPRDALIPSDVPTYRSSAG
jgi:uncharacterized membrane protein SpoIIM required for sporulation